MASGSVPGKRQTGMPDRYSEDHRPQLAHRSPVALSAKKALRAAASPHAKSAGRGSSAAGAAGDSSRSGHVLADVGCEVAAFTVSVSDQGGEERVTVRLEEEGEGGLADSVRTRHVRAMHILRRSRRRLLLTPLPRCL